MGRNRFGLFTVVFHERVHILCERELNIPFYCLMPAVNALSFPFYVQHGARFQATTKKKNPTKTHVNRY